MTSNHVELLVFSHAVQWLIQKNNDYVMDGSFSHMAKYFFCMRYLFCFLVTFSHPHAD
jgi:hypothetical protein